MGNRSRFVIGAGMTAAVVAAVRRRRRLRDAALGIGATIEPSIVPPSFEPAPDEGSPWAAPGHRHRSGDDDAAVPSRTLRRRPWTLHGHRTRHPYAAD